MNTHHATPANKPKAQTHFTGALEQEAGELDALHAGLVRHLDAWRGAHDATILRLGAVMARMDAVLERVEARRSRG